MTKSKNGRYTFYCVIIKETEDDEAEYDTYGIRSNLTAYTENEYLFRMYLKYYGELLKNLSTSVSEYKDVTHDQFLNMVLEDFGLPLSTDNYIMMESIELINNAVLYTNDILYFMEDYLTGWGTDMFRDTFLTDLFEAHELFCSKYGKYFTDKLLNIKRIMERVCGLYVPLVVMSEMGECGEDGFLMLPDHVKIILTKEAGFPGPLEDLEYWGIVNYAYQTMYFTQMVCDEGS